MKKLWQLIKFMFSGLSRVAVTENTYRREQQDWY